MPDPEVLRQVIQFFPVPQDPGCEQLQSAVCVVDNRTVGVIIEQISRKVCEQFMNLNREIMMMTSMRMMNMCMMMRGQKCSQAL